MLQLVSPKRRSRWSAAHSSPYEMGGPPGARSGNRRRAYPHNWELRDPARYGDRFVEELESEDDDGQGVTLDPNVHALRDARQRGFRGDELYFDGYDLGPDRTTRRGVYDDAYYDDCISEEEEYLQQQGSRYQAPVRDKQDLLLQTALDRIARAKEKGKTNVNLSREEMDALSAGRGQQLEPSSSLASPPVTPAKPSKIKASSRQSSTGSLTGQKTRKKSTSGFFGSPAKSTSSKAKIPRKNSIEHAPSYPSAPPGIMVPGPDGRPVWTPISYGPPSPELQRAQPVGSRSSSKHSRRESTPPEQLPPFASRYPGMRPESSGSNRSMPDDVDWYPPPSRTRSASNAQYGRHPPSDDYDMAPPMPAAQGRRNVSGPPDVRYANLRRQPASGSPLAPRAQPAGRASPVAARMSSGSHGSALRRVETSSSDSSEGAGVQVDVVPEDNGGYAVRQTSGASPPVERTSSGTPTRGGAEARRRKSGRR
ncbi:hypothetical protein CLAFUW4_10403 [Fulvia fulva]|uniref:Uncharacterized protein n=1 Tax=Passalora fulva TaxID=5499 RepID=A0A9Q8LFH7_PASFU|nr:uncharacterized protein CLAFUR5_05018 [Fulvia fulva]KAK4615546.1 hypothetical protein CLAFUR4_10407 [Fulvia fulva]KAK4616806.1 hypothetical protein CLAFUR0_10408 [Fulvia fulva]UJO16466.1 hypothetical protein CLAFUR5_05018 [Fulvia fulva]WPV18946.1 hypothetical protein CLAFUW4_10403 [Fulvia fulva]WPV34214.1 hypothetical protein CLAFUW7_10403 [Fulvia fulva]